MISILYISNTPFLLIFGIKEVYKMIGIYKIENKINGKIYIGQSNNLERRKTEHFNGSTKQEIDRAIVEEGKENFTFTVIEYCKESELDALEQYWIAYYDSYYNGYNHTKGGQNSFCGHPILTKEDIIHIREAYAAHQRRKNIYLLYKDKISEGGFNHIWDGSRWGDIMPEVYTQENKENQHKLRCVGENNGMSKLSNEEVIKIRQRYQTETARQIWQDYKHLYSYGSFQQVLNGYKYKELPIYKKSEKRWINIDESDE